MKKSKETKNQKFKKALENILPIVCLILGICLVLYSGIATFIADYTQTKVAAGYEEHLQEMKQENIDELKEKAKKYNETIAKVAGVETPEETKKYNKELKERTIFKVGEMEGYITIPKINVVLPIYEGTKESSLYKGVGHIMTSSLPSGGKGTHCVLAGHSGLSSATLFDDLDQLKINDVFFIKFLDETHKYKVDKITPYVIPDDGDKYIRIEKDKDYCTLLTCTPKTINTHRLLVRGKRTKMTEQDKKSQGLESLKKIINKKETQMQYAVYIITFIILIILIILLVKQIKKKKK